MSSTTNRVLKLALVAGFVGLAAAVLVAHWTPATGYELSLYTATPGVVWAGLAVALAAGGIAVLTAGVGRIRQAGVLLVVGAALSVYAMPAIRGYEFYGAGDALSHVGWAREIATGALEPTNLLYPGVHSATVFVAGVADVSLPLATLYVVLVAFPLVFLLFVPLATQLLADTPGAYGVGLLAAVLFVPINNISVHPIAHPASQAILVVAVILYLALAYTVGVLDRDASANADGRNRRERATVLGSRFTATGAGVLLAVASAAIVLVHPQQALNLALVFVAVSLVQLVVRRYTSSHPIATHRPLYAHTAVLLGAFALWTPRFERAQDTFVYTVQNIIQQGPSAGGVVSSKSASLTVVGGSLPELFLKLFGTATVMSLLAAGLLVVALRNHRRGSDSLVGYVAAGFVPLVAIFLVVLASDAGDMYFRYQGFIMVPVTVVGAAALARAGDWLAGQDRRTASVLAVAALLVLVPVGLVAVHPSPYVYKPSQHITDRQLAGYDAAFETRDSDVSFTGLRGGPRRYVDYHYGTEQARTTLEFPGYRDGTLPATFANASYGSAWNETRYLATTRSDRRIEVQLYDGLRYPERGYRAFETTPGVNRVRTNGEFELYVVEEDDA